MADLRKPLVLVGIGLAVLLLSVWVSVRAGSASTVANMAPAADASTTVAALVTAPRWPTTDTSGLAANSACTWPPPFAYSDFAVASTYRWPIMLSAGDTLEAEFVVGQGKNVTFRVEDPRGNLIYDPGQVAASHSFSITVGEAGVYRMIFGKDCFFCARDVQSRYRIY